MIVPERFFVKKPHLGIQKIYETLDLDVFFTFPTFPKISTTHCEMTASQLGAFFFLNTRYMQLQSYNLAMLDYFIPSADHHVLI